MSGESTDLLLQLIQKCKCSVTVTVNQHRDYHESVQDHMNGLVEQNAADMEDFADVLPEMIARDTIIDVHFYPKTSVGYFNVYHYDLIEALKKALSTFADQMEYPNDGVMMATINEGIRLDDGEELPAILNVKNPDEELDNE